MPSHKAEVAVLGAGPAGCIAARQLGMAGIDVVLVDAGATVGGHAMESFPASGAPLAEDIGLLAAICAVSEGPADRMHLQWPEAPETRVFDGDGPLLLPRGLLHDALRVEARRHVRFLEARVRGVSTDPTGGEVKTDAGDVTCRMVVDARGRTAVKRPGSDLVALAFSARSAAPARTMWLEALPDGWLWGCSDGADGVHGVLFQRSAVFSGMRARGRRDHLCGQLSRSVSFAGVTDIKTGRPMAAGLSAVADPVLTPRHVLAGDAALARDPIASHGLVHAIRSGVQVAAAVRTVLDPAGDNHAALSFLRHKHTEAVQAARLATARAYGDQGQCAGDFWTQHAEALNEEPLPQIGSGPVTLAAPLTRAPVLEGESIRWKPAIALPARQDFFTGFGPVSALDIAAACRPSAPLSGVAQRLRRQHAAPVVADVLHHLAQGGAFAQASELS